MAEEDSFEKVKKGLKETGEGPKEGVEETAEGVKETAEEITDPDTYTESDVEMRRENTEYNNFGGSKVEQKT